MLGVWAAIQLMWNCGITAAPSGLPLSIHLPTSEGRTAELAAVGLLVVATTEFDVGQVSSFLEILLHSIKTLKSSCQNMINLPSHKISEILN